MIKRATKKKVHSVTTLTLYLIHCRQKTFYRVGAFKPPPAKRDIRVDLRGGQRMIGDIRM